MVARACNPSYSGGFFNGLTISYGSHTKTQTEIVSANYFPSKLLLPRRCLSSLRLLVWEELTISTGSGQVRQGSGFQGTRAIAITNSCQSWKYGTSQNQPPSTHTRNPNGREHSLSGKRGGVHFLLFLLFISPFQRQICYPAGLELTD